MLNVCNPKEKVRFVYLLDSCLFGSLVFCFLLVLSGCGGIETRNDVDNQFKPKKLTITGEMEFQFAPSDGRKELIRLQSRTTTRTFTKGQLLHEREELVEFGVRNTVTQVEAGSGLRSVLVETVSKDGPQDLYDLGYPELGESIDYVFNTKGEVRKAGNFPSNSIFFIPPVVLPKRPVAVDETWTMQRDWISLRNGLPMTVDILTIFKNVYACGNNHKCAELEISGEVRVPESLRKKAKIQSMIVGRLLYNMNTGAIVWSDVRNKDVLGVEDDRVESSSCTESVLESPAGERWPWRPKANCDPNRDIPTRVPGETSEPT
jgi:hypothetical protein